MSTTRKTAAALRTKPAPTKASVAVLRKASAIGKTSSAIAQDDAAMAQAQKQDTLGVSTPPAAPSMVGAAHAWQAVARGNWARGETLQSDSRPYLLYYRGTRYALIGPFGTTDEASSWALDKRNNPHDDPRWHVIELAPEHRMPRLATPWEASLAIQAGNL